MSHFLLKIWWTVAVLANVKSLSQVSLQCGKFEQPTIGLSNEGNCDECQEKIKNIEERLSQLERVASYPPTCHEVRRENLQSGNYTISPEPENVLPFVVYCNFNGSITETIINHDSMSEKEAIHGCGVPRCSKNPIRYNLKLSQIKALTNQSSSCRQFLKYRCSHTLFLAQGYAAWLDRNGDPQFYWGGATSRREGYCACGETGTCKNTRYNCNCDKNTGSETSDEGYLTDKDKLPVTELQVGDLNDSSEYGYYTVGSLICTGGSG